MSRRHIFGEDTPPIDLHPLRSGEPYDAARTRIAADAAFEARAVRSRLALEGASVHHVGHGDSATSYQRRLRAELGMVEVRRLRRMAEWMLAYHARWAGVWDSDALQCVVARAYSNLGAFFDPQREAFLGVDVRRAVREAASEVGGGELMEMQSAAVH